MPAKTFAQHLCASVPTENGYRVTIREYALLTLIAELGRAGFDLIRTESGWGHASVSETLQSLVDREFLVREHIRGRNENKPASIWSLTPTATRWLRTSRRHKGERQ